MRGGAASALQAGCVRRPLQGGPARRRCLSALIAWLLKQQLWQQAGSPRSNASAPPSHLAIVSLVSHNCSSCCTPDVSWAAEAVAGAAAAPSGWPRPPARLLNAACWARTQGADHLQLAACHPEGARATRRQGEGAAVLLQPRQPPLSVHVLRAPSRGPARTRRLHTCTCCLCVHMQPPTCPRRRRCCCRGCPHPARSRGRPAPRPDSTAPARRCSGSARAHTRARMSPGAS